MNHCVSRPRLSTRWSAVVLAAVSLGLVRLAIASEDSPSPAPAARSTDSIRALAKLAGAPESASRAHWQVGRVQFEGEWLSVEEIAERLQNDSRVAAYRQRRQQLDDSAESHMQLAAWCRANRLEEEERAHWLVARRLAPNDPRPSRALNLVRHSGRGVSPDQLSDSIKSTTASREVWSKRIDHLREQLQHSDAEKRRDAEHQIGDIRDPIAIPELERSISLLGEKQALVVVASMGDWLHGASTQSLVRHAVWHPSKTVREAAVDQLKKRDREHYVGYLIQLLRPSASGETFARLPNGQPTQVWYVEEFDKRYVDVITFVPRDGWRAWEDPRWEADVVRDAIQQKSSEIQAINDFRLNNAAMALIAATGMDFGRDQSAWLNWWKDVAYFDPISLYTPEKKTFTQNHVVRSGAPSCSCFIAGTPVWTKRGPVPIDHVQLGDLVLSMDVDRGELGFRPVLDRTIRRSKEIVSLEVDGSRVGATTGHPFWVPGSGWKTAVAMKRGDRLHSPAGPITLAESQPGTPEPVYNLVVDEFHTFFVGDSRILVHDFTPVGSGTVSVAE